VGVWLGERWFTVIGILDPPTLDRSLDSAAVIGFDAAGRLLQADRDDSTIYLRADPDAITGVRELLGRTANPEHPDDVEVSRPPDTLDAPSRRVGAEFLAESLLLAAVRAKAGVLLGAPVTAGYAPVKAGRPSCRRSRSAVASPPRPPSPPSPASTPPLGPPECHPPRRRGGSEHMSDGHQNSWQNGDIAVSHAPAQSARRERSRNCSEHATPPVLDTGDGRLG
jgi:hypothetical protein